LPSPAGKAITVAADVPAQLHVPHERVAARCGTVMAIFAGNIQARTRLARTAAGNGDLLLADAFADPADGAALVLKAGR
jgi:hypothetical protein